MSEIKGLSDTLVHTGGRLLHACRCPSERRGASLQQKHHHFLCRVIQDCRKICDQWTPYLKAASACPELSKT